MNNMFFSIDRAPIAQQRPRFSNYNGKNRVFDPNGSQKRSIKWDVAKQMRDKGYLKAAEGPVEVNLISYHKIPASWSKKRSKEALHTYVAKKPDCDNICKTYLDILNGIAYADDKQVCSLKCEKIYSENPRVEIEVCPIDSKKRRE